MDENWIKVGCLDQLMVQRIDGLLDWLISGWIGPLMVGLDWSKVGWIDQRLDQSIIG